MCGIAGSFSYDESVAVNTEAVRLASAAMTVRGPDGDGFWQHDDQSIALAHRRLAIIDLSSSAAQPMSDSSGRYVITYNGEIYNYIELRQQCEQQGYQFTTQSDTEVLLALYQLYQADMLTCLRGMYAFAICDTVNKSLLLARDPHGIKPLYIVEHNQGGTKQCYFASSLQALIKADLIDEQKTDSAATAGFFQTGSVPEPFTWYQQAKQLLAGTYLLLSQEQESSDSSRQCLPQSQSDIALLPSKHYWHLPSVVETAQDTMVSNVDAPDLICKAITESVRAHMIADVPVGIFLSAGIDSGVLASLMGQYSERPITAITLRFAEYKDTAQDESILAAEIARRYGMEHHIYTLNKEEFIEELPMFFAAMEQPTIDALNTWFVAKAAKHLGLKVVISGVGGDELFGGYPSFKRIPKLLSLRPLLSSFFKLPFSRSLYRRVLKMSGNCRLSKWAALPDYANSVVSAYRLQRGVFLSEELAPDLQQALMSLERVLDLTKLTIAGADVRRNVSLLESQCYLRNQLLRDADWAGMAHSVEIRTPLVDSQLSEALAVVPDSVLYQKNKGALAQLLPEADFELLSSRPKTGFTLPMRAWLNQREQFPEGLHWSQYHARHVVERFDNYN